MEVLNGVVVLGDRACFRCQGNKETMLRKPCPNYGKVTNRRPCAHCASTRKDGHAYLDIGVGTCPDCKGVGTRPETMSDYLPVEVWAGMRFVVYRENRAATWNEQYLGSGCVYSTVDYGRSRDMTDEALAEEVRTNKQSAQASTICDRDGRLADHIGIFTNRSGFSVRPVFATPDGLVIRTANLSGLGGGVRAAVEASGGI